MIKALAMSLLAVSPLTAVCSDTATDAHPVVADLAPSLSVQTVNGSGCAPSTVTTTASANDVTAAYTGFAVTAGGTNNRKVCQFNVLVHPGAGQQAVVDTANHTGTATLPAGTSGTVSTTYYVTAGSNLAVTSSPLTAPSWNVNQPTPAGSVVTACGTDVALNIKVELKVSGAGSAAAANTSDVHVNWQNC